MVVGIPKENYPEEKRVALIPLGVQTLTKAGMEVVIESGAGEQAGFPDKMYQEKGAKIADKRTDIFAKSDIVLQVRGLGA
ncbi:NAD(P)(+) transhydrogenase (Re/Si-specific) subunit alpha, partial [Candidatus Saccharibacteria bacterium]|nr:NAD(P)(+) transhydrogenase (Re/Si-specific) subunit alpha [Candidatus Saccharibacteria bacterium]NIV72718.1 NAD(P)(+) transhydrogenase (Re/Si-specific) subunit alpha [Calditrichia bacterium]NIW80248.1 NAD(P)(+) transhydrogenase (Re/Si-specific) subunit alpha [Calditrichia bacterium]